MVKSRKAPSPAKSEKSLRPRSNRLQSYLKIGDRSTMKPLPALRALVGLSEIDNLEIRLAAFGGGEVFKSIFASARERLSIVQDLHIAAAAVLAGEPHGRQKLRILVGAARNLVRESADAWHHISEISNFGGSTPRLVDGASLIAIVFATELCGTSRADAKELQSNLIALLEPLAVLDAIFHTLENTSGAARNSSLDVMATSLKTSEFRRLCEKDEAMVTPLKSPKYGVRRPDFNVSYAKGPVHWEFPCLESEKRRASALNTLKGTGLSPAVYVLASISNQGACPGEIIKLKGSNFGLNGRVVFPIPQADDPSFGVPIDAFDGVPAIKWTNTEIEVVVPPWATAGELSLASFVRHESSCLAIDYYTFGNTITFEGGIAQVYDVQINGRPAIMQNAVNNFEPGAIVVLSWKVRSGPDVFVDVVLSDNGVSLWQARKTGGGSTTVLVQIPDDKKIIEPTKVYLKFTADSKCGTTARPYVVPCVISHPPLLTIEWIEVTQGVQTVQDGVSRMAPMPMAAFKDTAIRVHFKCRRKNNWATNSVSGITGVLFFDGNRFAPDNRGGVGLYYNSRDQEGATTLNFTIPGGMLSPGIHRIAVDVVCADPAGRIKLHKTIHWEWIKSKSLRIRCLWLGSENWKGPAMIDYARRAVDYLPFELNDIGVASVGNYDDGHDLLTEDGWGDLLEELENSFFYSDESDGEAILLAIIPSTRPRAIDLGMAHTPGIVAIAVDGRPDVAAHELGHCLGLSHVNLVNPCEKDKPCRTIKGPFHVVDLGGFLRRPPWEVRDKVAIGLPGGDLMSYFEPIRPGIDTWTALFPK
jgi:hypothetical protein